MKIAEGRMHMTEKNLPDISQVIAEFLFKV
jgi:hypothetical protein